MRYLKSFLILAAASVLAFSCKKDEPTVVTKPEAPVIENASLKGLNGESVVIAGNNVKFSATLKVKGSKLGKFSLGLNLKEPRPWLKRNSTFRSHRQLLTPHSGLT